MKHAFLWRLYSELWQRDPDTKVLVFDSEIDDSGFDLAVSVGKYTRHIQLKSSMIGSSTRSVPLQQSLCALPGGCVVWMEYLPSTLEVQSYLLFAYSNPSEPLDFRNFQQAKTVRANSKGEKKFRPGCYRVPKTAFNELPFERLTEVLFGRATPRNIVAVAGDLTS